MSPSDPGPTPVSSPHLAAVRRRSLAARRRQRWLIAGGLLLAAWLVAALHETLTDNLARAENWHQRHEQREQARNACARLVDPLHRGECERAIR